MEDIAYWVGYTGSMHQHSLVKISVFHKNYQHNNIYLTQTTAIYSMGRTKQQPPAGSKSEPLHKVAKQPGAGKRLDSQAKLVVQNVRSFFEKERHQGKSICRNQVVHRTANATGISVRSVSSQLERSLSTTMVSS